MKKFNDRRGRQLWFIATGNGNIVRVMDDPQRGCFFRIAAGGWIFQYPKSWLTIRRHLDPYHAEGSEESQTLVWLSINAPEVDCTIAMIPLANSEYAALADDPTLGRSTSSCLLNKDQCDFTDQD